MYNRFAVIFCVCVAALLSVQGVLASSDRQPLNLHREVAFYAFPRADHIATQLPVMEELQSRGWGVSLLVHQQAWSLVVRSLQGDTVGAQNQNNIPTPDTVPVLINGIKLFPIHGCWLEGDRLSQLYAHLSTFPASHHLDLQLSALLDGHDACAFEAVSTFLSQVKQGAFDALTGVDAVVCDFMMPGCRDAVLSQGIPGLVGLSAGFEDDVFHAFPGFLTADPLASPLVRPGRTPKEGDLTGDFALWKRVWRPMLEAWYLFKMRFADWVVPQAWDGQYSASSSGANVASSCFWRLVGLEQSVTSTDVRESWEPPTIPSPDLMVANGYDQPMLLRAQAAYNRRNAALIDSELATLGTARPSRFARTGSGWGGAFGHAVDAFREVGQEEDSGSNSVPQRYSYVFDQGFQEHPFIRTVSWGFATPRPVPPLVNYLGPSVLSPQDAAWDRSEPLEEFLAQDKPVVMLDAGDIDVCSWYRHTQSTPPNPFVAQFQSHSCPDGRESMSVFFAAFASRYGDYNFVLRVPKPSAPVLAAQNVYVLYSEGTVRDIPAVLSASTVSVYVSTCDARNVQLSLLFGVSNVCVPVFMWQYDVARQVKHLGVGSVIDTASHTHTHAHLHTTVQSVLCNARMKSRRVLENAGNRRRAATDRATPALANRLLSRYLNRDSAGGGAVVWPDENARAALVTYPAALKRHQEEFGADAKPLVASGCSPALLIEKVWWNDVCGEVPQLSKQPNTPIAGVQRPFRGYVSDAFSDMPDRENTTTMQMHALLEGGAIRTCDLLEELILSGSEMYRMVGHDWNISVQWSFDVLVLELVIAFITALALTTGLARTCCYYACCCCCCCHLRSSASASDDSKAANDVKESGNDVKNSAPTTTKPKAD